MICFTCFEINQIISSFHNYFPEKLNKQKQKQNKQTNKHKKNQTNKQKSVRRNFVLYTLWVVFVKHVRKIFKPLK